MELRTDTDALPLTSALVPLIRQRGREVLFATKKGDKQDLVATRKPRDRFFAAWPGEWRTDVFEVSTEKLATL